MMVKLSIQFSVLQLVSHHVIKIQEIGFTELQRVVGLHQILAGNADNYMLGNTTKLSMPFQVLGL